MAIPVGHLPERRHDDGYAVTAVLTINDQRLDRDLGDVPSDGVIERDAADIYTRAQPDRGKHEANV